MCMPPLSGDPAAARPIFVIQRELAATAFYKVERNVYFRAAIDGHECRLHGRRARRGDDRESRERALLTR